MLANMAQKSLFTTLPDYKGISVTGLKILHPYVCEVAITERFFVSQFKAMHEELIEPLKVELEEELLYT